MKDFEFQSLAGQKVIDASIHHEEATTLYFLLEDKTSFTIHTSFICTPNTETLINAIVGASINKIESNDKNIFIVFSNNMSLRINLDDVNFEGYELLEVRWKGNDILIWN